MTELSCAECRPPCPLVDLPSSESQALNGLVRSVIFLPQQALFEQGDPHQGCYFICEGVAVLQARTANGRRLAIGLVGPGDLLGVGGFLGQRRHELSAQAITEIRARHLTRATCERLVQEPSVLSSRLLAVMARQIKQLRRQAQFLASRAGVRERLAALLLELGDHYGKSSKSGRRLELRLSCELLGELLDSHRVTVTRKLNELLGRGLIEREQGCFIIVDEAGLRQLAEDVF